MEGHNGYDECDPFKKARPAASILLGGQDRLWLLQEQEAGEDYLSIKIAPAKEEKIAEHNASNQSFAGTEKHGLHELDGSGVGVHLVLGPSALDQPGKAYSVLGEETGQSGAGVEGVGTHGGETSLIKPLVSEGSHVTKYPGLILWGAPIVASSGWAGHPEGQKEKHG